MYALSRHIPPSFGMLQSGKTLWVLSQGGASFGHMPTTRVEGYTAKGILESAKRTEGDRGRLQLPNVTCCGSRRMFQLLFKFT
ncbi:hypothetical protein RB195_022953 [Necator americanus]|uniref:Uncharacterized protein n=1 Tax=Necator americanus TaxID=51031 RepID=A0ABR1EH87_NECAM